jgi:pilus assembly protein FimV
MMTRTFASVAVMAALGLLAPMQVNAFGLGKLELSSALNEPFKAEIGITALKGDDVNNLQVRLASRKEFEQAGIELNFLLAQLKFNVIEESGNVKIVISSQQPIREPFIDFLLTATTTGSDRLIREYTVLLDPPKSIFNTPAAKPLVQSPSKTSVTTSVTSTNYKSASFDGDSYGPVIRTDTLWGVALKNRSEQTVTVHQMMLALLKANPRAFQHENVNGLKAGYTLSIPSTDDIYKLTKQQAVNAFSEQNTLWKNRNVRPTIDTADKTIAPTAEEMPVIGKDVATDATEAVAEVNDTARLKLVVPNDQASLNDEALSPLGAEKIKVLSEQLTLAQETIEGQTQENIDFKARMDALEVQMETMRRLISLKDADLARLQSMLENDQQPDENTPPALVDDADINTKDVSLDSTIDNSTLENELHSMLVTAQKIVANNKLEMAIGAGSLLLLLVVMLIAKRRKESDSADEWDKAQHQVNNDDEGLVAVQPTVDIDNKLVADMLVAYADYEKAMALLEQAQQQEASDQLVLSKLLYVMFKQQQTEPFVTLASGLNIDKDSPEWSEIAAWGRQLAPLNTLFHLATDDSEPASDLTFDSFSEVKDDELFAESISAPEVDEIEDNVPNTIEFNLDDYDTEELVSTADTVIAVPDEINNNDESLTFDTSFSLNNEDEKPDFDTPLNFESDSDDDELSLNNEPLSLDLTEGTYQADLLGTDENLQDLEPENSDFEFDISGYDEIDEAETKLDLASAYADMGDPNGARNILEEVLKEGNAEQKSKAQALLKNLS